MSKYVSKDGKFNSKKWIREMTVMTNQDINGQGNSLAYRFTDTQQKAVEKFLKKNSAQPEVKELLGTRMDKYSSGVYVKIGRGVYELYASRGVYRLGAGGKLSRWTPAMEKEVVKFLGEGKIELAESANDNRMKVLNTATYKRMDGLHHVRNMKSAMNFLIDIAQELQEEGFEREEIAEFIEKKVYYNVMLKFL